MTSLLLVQATTDSMTGLVVHIIDRLPPDGAERLIVEVLRYRSDRYQYEVLCLAQGGALVAELESTGVPVTILGKKKGIDIAHAIELYRWLRRRKPAIVHTHLFTADAWGRSCAWLANVPGIFSTIHSNNSWKSRTHLLVDRCLAGVSNRIIACSQGVRDTLVEQGLSSAKLVSIPNGIDLARIDAAQGVDIQTEFCIDANSLVLALVGRLHPAKGHSDLLAALALLLENRSPQQPTFVVLFIGEGELEAELKAEVTARHLQPYVRFAGFRTDVINLLKSIDYLLMPSHWEGLPMTLLESMACGAPALASKVGGIPDVIEHKRNGFLFSAGDIEELCQGIQLLLQSGKATIAADQDMRNAARSTVVQRYSAESVAAAYDALYDAVE